MNDLEGEKKNRMKKPLLSDMKAVTDIYFKSKIVAFILQIRLPLTFRLIIFNHNSYMFAVPKYELHSCPNAKIKIMVSSIPLCETWISKSNENLLRRKKLVKKKKSLVTSY